ncbi:MAG: choice-of-anchor D domain-containing protein [Chthoniobacteraceae bacterium]
MHSGRSRVLPALVLLVAALAFEGFLAHPAAAQVPSALKYSIAAPAAGFGSSVAVSGSLMVVGAPDSESAFVYDLSSATPAVPVFTLNNPSVGTDDFFGTSVAISGSRVVVGAPADDTGADDAGRVYVYNLGSGTPTLPANTLNNPSPEDGDAFGSAVAIAGTRVVVGAPADDTGTDDAGSAYVYNLSSGTPTVPVTTLINPSPAVNDQFGTSVAISGALVVVGALADDAGAEDSGSAYVYNVGGVTPAVPVATLNNPGPAAGDRFGFAVAISGTRVVVGAVEDDTGALDAGSAYVYDVAGGTPTVPVSTLNNPGPAAVDHFGSAVAISGTLVVVGVPNDAANIGSTHLFDLTGAMPTVPVATLHKLSPAADDYFGTAVAADGNTVVIGTPFAVTPALDSGGVYVFGAPFAPEPDTLFHSIPAGGAGFGTSVALSGTLMVVGAPDDDTGATDAGSASVYDLSSGTPTVPVFTLLNPSPAMNDRFGRSVAISGTRVAVGAYQDDTGAIDAGSAYVYDLTSGTPTVPVVTLNNPGPAAGDRFGFAVAISGTRVVVGAYQEDTGETDSGSAYVYDLTSGTPAVPVFTLNHPSPETAANFGFSLAIDGLRVVVGAYLNDTGADDAGSAYVYDLGSGTPTVPAFVLHNPGPEVDDRFGNSVGISGTRVVVGAAGDATGAEDAGSVYVYDLSGGTPTAPAFTLNNPAPEVFGLFGTAVAVSGRRVVGGAPANAGYGASTFVYDLNSPTPTVPVVTLQKPGVAEEDNFGSAVTIDGTTAAVGAPFSPTNVVYPGAVYVFGTTAIPGIAVEVPVGVTLLDGTSSVSFGSVVVGASSAPKVFTIRNTGVADLTGLSVTKDGPNSGDFTVSALGATTLTTGQITTFTVTFNPVANGPHSAAIHIASNVGGSKNPFDLAFAGTGGVDSFFFAGSVSPGALLDVIFGRTGHALTGVSGVTGGTAMIVGGKVRFVVTDLINGGNFTFTATNNLAQPYTETVRVWLLASAAGTYVGLLRDGSNVVRGRVKVSLTSTGLLTGNVQRDGGTLHYGGTQIGARRIDVFTSVKTVRIPLTITPGDADAAGQPTLLASIDAPLGGTLTGTLERCPYKSTNPTPQAGRYTMVANLPPAGTGPATGAMLTCNITAAGNVTFAGRRGNAGTFSAGGQLLTGGRHPLYQGFGTSPVVERLAGELVFDKPASPAVTGTLRWRVPAGVNVRLPAGVDQDYTVLGMPYTAGANAAAMYSPPAATATMTLQLPSVSVPPLTQTVDLTGTPYRGMQRVIYRYVPVHIDLFPSSGFFFGEHNPAREVRRYFFGVVLQGAGYNYGQGNTLDYTSINAASLTPP